MKNFLPLILLFFCGVVSMNAQIRVFKDITCTEEITDGGRMTFTTAEEDPFLSGNHVMGEMAPYFAPADLSTPTDYEVSITVIPTDGAQFSYQWCGISGNCQQFSSSTTSATRVGTTSGLQLGEKYMPGSSDNMNLEFFFTPGVESKISVKVDVTCDGDPVLTFYEIFLYDGTAASIASASTDNALRFNGTGFNYNFDTMAPRALNVYGADGKLVKSEHFSAQGGTLGLDGLTRGVYIYQLTENGKRTKSGKVVVR